MKLVSISKMIQDIMAYNSWNQQEFAQRFRFEPCQVSRWLQGKAMPRAESYILIKEKYDEIPEKFA